MTAPLGRALILIALLAATCGAFVAFAAGRRDSAAGLRWARWCAFVFGGSMLLANFLMIFALLSHDFSVSYVAQVGSRALPTWVSIVSLWSSLEGSILFWGAVLGLYIVGGVATVGQREARTSAYAIGVWLATAAFFSFLIAGPAQPFHTVVNPLTDGPGPNPLLQNHILMAVHPPFLYLGYVGMTIPFGIAAAALLSGTFGYAMAGTLRRTLLLPWIFQTIAIVLGGWWAYEVLGWGGYWAWDPVENASLLPWSTATAALHSILVVERRRSLKGWTVTLVLATFLLTILGTFMTRSGVFNSVHSFTQSAIGPTILVFLAAMTLFSIVLLALRIDSLSSESPTSPLASRETMFLVNNLLFVLLTFTVLIGTVFPLIVEAVKGVQMSVGRPYFDRMTVPMGVALLFLMGVGPSLPWGRATRQQLRDTLLLPFFSAVLMAGLGLSLGVRNFWTLTSLFCAGYALQVTLTQLWSPLSSKTRRGVSLPSAAVEVHFTKGRRRFGAYIAHLGAVVIIASIAVSSTMQVSREAFVRKGQSASIGRYTLTFLGAEEVREPHRISTLARFEVRDGQRVIGSMTPAMNLYERQREPIGTPDVRSSLFSDLYVSILNVDPAAQTVAVHLLINPMVPWIWGSMMVIAIGGFAAWLPRRRTAIELSNDSMPLAASLREEVG